MLNLNVSKKNRSHAAPSKIILSLFLGIAFVFAWCPLGSAAPEVIAVTPWTSDAIGQAQGYSINDAGTAFTLNVTAGFPDIFTDNAGVDYTLPAVVTTNADLSSIVFSSDSNVHGTIGSTASFADLTLTGTTSVDFWGTVNTTTMHVATGTANFKSGTNNNNAAVIFTGDGEVILDSNTTVVGAMTNQGSQQGTLTLNNLSKWDGAVGGATGLRNVNIVGSGASATVTGAVNTYQLDLLTNTLNVGGSLTVADNGVINTTVTTTGYGKVITTGAVTIGTGAVINQTIEDGASLVDATDIVSNYTAPITVSVVTLGALAVDGDTTLAGDLTQSGGTVDLGTNTLTLDNYTSGANTLGVTVSGTTSGGIDISAGAGTVDLATGTVDITTDGYVSTGTTYQLVTLGAAGTLIAPATIVDDSFLLDFTLDDTTGVMSVASSGGGGLSALSTSSTNANAAGAALQAADNAGATGDMATVLGELQSATSGQAISDALETMVPDVSSAALMASREITNQGFALISNRLGGARNISAGSGVSSGDMGNGVGFWVQGLGSHMKQDERKGVEGYSADLFGTTIGVDKMIDNHFRAGLAVGYGNARLNSKTPGSPSDDIESWQGTIYGSYDSLDLSKAQQGGKKSPEAVRSQLEDHWYVDGMLAFTQNNYDSSRDIWVTPVIKRVATADHDAQQYSAKFETGYTFVSEKTKALEITPFFGLGYNYLYMGQYEEKGAGALNLSVDGEGFHQLEQTLGVKLAYPVVNKEMGTFIPSVKAAWLYDYFGDSFETSASFAGGGGSFTTKGAKPAKNGMLLGAEVAFLNKGNMTVTANYDLELKDEYMSSTYYCSVRFDF